MKISSISWMKLKTVERIYNLVENIYALLAILINFVEVLKPSLQYIAITETI